MHTGFLSLCSLSTDYLTANLPIINPVRRHVVLKCDRRAAYEIHNTRGKYSDFHFETCLFMMSYSMENTKFSIELQTSSQNLLRNCNDK
jgi:hypothetical protein